MRRRSSLPCFEDGLGLARSSSSSQWKGSVKDHVEINISWLQGELDGLVGGGLALAGWTHSKPDLGIDFYGFVVVLDAEGQNDCMLRLSNDNGYHYPFEPFGASDGAIYVNGHVQKSGDWHSMLLRVR